MKIIEEEILCFNEENDYKPNNYPPEKNGFYMTIRCGLGGIYSTLNEWRDGHWMAECADASRTIAYSCQSLPREKVNEWLESLLNEVKKENIRKEE